MRFILLFLNTVLLATAGPVESSDWAQWRGPKQDGISTERGILTAWPEDGPKVIWRAKAGQGYSGMSIREGRLFTQYADSTHENLVCLDSASGAEQWRVQIDSLYTNKFGNGSRSTPTIDGGVVYALSPYGKLFAVNAADGKLVWTVNLIETYQGRVPDWGVSTSPVVNGEQLIVNNCGSGGFGVIALKKTTGELIWKSESPSDSYSTPLIVSIAGIEQALVFKADALISLSTKDGSRLWEYPWISNMGQSNATPVFIEPDKVFISSYSDGISALLQVIADEGQFIASNFWQYNKMWNHHSTSVFIDGHIYGFHRDVLKCLDVRTHEEKWVKRGFGHGTLVFADGHFFVQGEKGQLALIEASPSGYVEKAITRVLGEKCWTVPTLVDGFLYVRDEASIVCLDVKDR